MGVKPKSKLKLSTLVTMAKELIVPRLGPAVNLRPAGAHKQRRRKSRAQTKVDLRRNTDND